MERGGNCLHSACRVRGGRRTGDRGAGVGMATRDMQAGLGLGTGKLAGPPSCMESRKGSDGVRCQMEQSPFRRK